MPYDGSDHSTRVIIGFLYANPSIFHQIAIGDGEFFVGFRQKFMRYCFRKLLPGLIIRTFPFWGRSDSVDCIFDIVRRRRGSSAVKFNSSAAQWISLSITPQRSSVAFSSFETTAARQIFYCDGYLCYYLLVTGAEM